MRRQKGDLTGEGPRHSERADNSKISQIPNPSLALQASMVFAFIREPRPSTCYQSGLRPRAGLLFDERIGPPIRFRARVLDVRLTYLGINRLPPSPTSI